MGKKILERIFQSLRQVIAYADGEVPAAQRMHYFSMNPANGKMMRESPTYPRRRRKKYR